jgi:hypothetical protein
MYKRTLSLLVIIASSLIATGCVPTTFGVPQPLWDDLTPEQQQEVIRGHYKTRVAEIKNEPYYNYGYNKKYTTRHNYKHHETPELNVVHYSNDSGNYTNNTEIKHDTTYNINKKNINIINPAPKTSYKDNYESTVKTTCDANGKYTDPYSYEYQKRPQETSPATATPAVKSKLETKTTCDINGRYTDPNSSDYQKNTEAKLTAQTDVR